jgi:hypothetical protein
MDSQLALREPDAGCAAVLLRFLVKEVSGALPTRPLYIL